MGVAQLCGWNDKSSYAIFWTKLSQTLLACGQIDLKKVVKTICNI